MCFGYCPFFISYFAYLSFSLRYLPFSASNLSILYFSRINFLFCFLTQCLPLGIYSVYFALPCWSFSILFELNVLLICFNFIAMCAKCYEFLWRTALAVSHRLWTYVCVDLNSIPGTQICIRFLLLPNKLAPTSGLKQYYICYLTVSVGQKFRHGWAGLSV